MLKRAEARLHPQDFGPIETLFDDDSAARESGAGDRRAAGALPGRRDAASCTRPMCRSSSRCARRWASRSTSCPSSTRTCGAGGAATRCGRPTTPATPPTRCASFPAPRRSRASPASTSRSANCSTASSRPSIDEVLASRRAEPVAGGVAPPGSRRRHRSAGRRARLARRAVGRPHRDQPGAPHRCAGGVAGQRKPKRDTPIHGCAPRASAVRPSTLSVPLSDIWIDIRFTLPSCTVDGGMPVVTVEDASTAMRSVLAIAAGVDGPDALPPVVDNTADGHRRLGSRAGRRPHRCHRDVRRAAGARSHAGARRAGRPLLARGVLGDRRGRHR